MMAGVVRRDGLRKLVELFVVDLRANGDLPIDRGFVIDVLARLLDAVPDVPPDPPAADREAIAAVIINAGLEPEFGADTQVADALLSSGVLVDAADVRARTLQDAAKELMRLDVHVSSAQGVGVAARWLRDRAVSEREGMS